MEVFLIVILGGIFTETTFLSWRKLRENKRNNSGRRKVFVDSSALMDRRILEIAKTGFLADEFLIPRSVTREMQLVADGADGEKRYRARIGLETVNELERVVEISTEIYDDAKFGRMPVDERLLQLAKENRGAVLTCDYNLIKVAETEHIQTLNVNELATVLSPKLQAGEKFTVRISEKGNYARQGVGHLADGTMVVVDGAGKKLGKEVEVEFTRYLQTVSGRMIFATLKK